MFNRPYLLAVLSLLLWPQLASAQSINIPNFPFVVAVGEAKRSVAPDMATITLTVEAFDKESAAAESKVAAASDAIIKTLKKNRMNEKAVEAGDLKKHVQHARSRNFDNNGIAGYNVSRNFTIKINDIKAYGKIAKALTRINNVVRTNSKFDVSNRDKIEADLLANALIDAQSKASVMAQSLGAKVGGVHAISQKGSFSAYMARFGVSDGYMAHSNVGYKLESKQSSFGGELVLFAPQELDISQSVNTVFRLK